MTRRVKQLHQAVPKAYVEMNRADAQALGVESATDRSRHEPPRIARASSQDRRRGKPPRGSVFVPFFDERRLVNELTLDAMDNISKEPDFKKCAVRIERT